MGRDPRGCGIALIRPLSSTSQRKATLVDKSLRELLLAERHGVLATLSSRRDGWPFASVVPFALTDAGDPLLLLSDLAEHTRNLRADSRASLLVQDSAAADDPQAGARVTLLGRIEALQDSAPRHSDQSDSLLEEARARYTARHPQAGEYLTMADFRLCVLHVTEARFIGGFGDMGWIQAAGYRDVFSSKQ
jgi:heme iron utilization protein